MTDYVDTTKEVVDILLTFVIATVVCIVISVVHWTFCKQEII